MRKKQLSKILARASAAQIADLAHPIAEQYKPVIVKEPSKTLSMIKMRDPVRQGQFFLGEVIVCDATVELAGNQGSAVLMGDDTSKVLDMAIIDAALNGGVFPDMDALYQLEAQQDEVIARENALHLDTLVNFESMDAAPVEDLGSFASKGGA
jgi:alpha-D-ribose 1-methylphosphonate 5-triphosphate synthase subunit PhnG